jgi:hypothetical protein
MRVVALAVQYAKLLDLDEEDAGRLVGLVSAARDIGWNEAISEAADRAETFWERHQANYRHRGPAAVAGMIGASRGVAAELRTLAKEPKG